MFPDNSIVKTFTMFRDKLRNVINNGLAPYFKELLEEKVSQSCYYTVSFDETLCDITQKSEIDIVIQYWDNIDKKLKIRFCGVHIRTFHTY